MNEVWNYGSISFREFYNRICFLPVTGRLSGQHPGKIRFAGGLICGMSGFWFCFDPEKPSAPAVILSITVAAAAARWSKKQCVFLGFTFLSAGAAMAFCCGSRYLFREAVLFMCSYMHMEADLLRDSGICWRMDSFIFLQNVRMKGKPENKNILNDRYSEMSESLTVIPERTAQQASHTGW